MVDLPLQQVAKAIPEKIMGWPRSAFVAQILDASDQEILERIMGFPQERLSDGGGEQTADVPVPIVVGEMGEVVRLISQESSQHCTIEENVVVPASKIQELLAGVYNGITQERMSGRVTEQIVCWCHRSGNKVRRRSSWSPIENTKTARGETQDLNGCIARDETQPLKSCSADEKQKRSNNNSTGQAGEWVPRRTVDSRLSNAVGRGREHSRFVPWPRLSEGEMTEPLAVLQVPPGARGP